ncbi:MAG TPA: F0F1 ATP synthase subunit delta [Patescibacteria group bacterium]|nr:F0F1 ATP synthase subunit delta [Patescibacteria group bacterium]
MMRPKAAGTLHLPVLVFGMVEVRRLRRELEALEEFMRQAKLREAGKQAALPRLSRLLDALAEENHLNLLHPTDRKQLQDFLQHMEQEAPIVHISFAADPSSAFTSKLVTWLRANIDPMILLDVGLQPIIAAGCVVRTNNKIFDLSLRERFSDARGLLLESLEFGTAPASVASPTVLPQPPTAPMPAPTAAVAAPVPEATHLQPTIQSAAGVAS